uniref:Uncharacterized protein n=1 Tax=Tanacetum cinerariifolium TaxID=118510 RepID=A0A6L2MS72_TANCI|nr:hypothetical protein [Tanacetum cinerariifolium]
MVKEKKKKLEMNNTCKMKVNSDKMAEENVPALTRTDAQLVPIKAHLPIGKSNLLMDSAYPFVPPPVGDLNSDYYKKHMEMATHKPRQPTIMTGEEVEMKKKGQKAVEDDEYNLHRSIQMILESLQALIGEVVIREPNLGFIRKLLDVEGKGKDSTNDAKTIADMEESNNETDTEILNVIEERGEEVSNIMVLEERTIEFDEGQAGSDPSKTPKSRPLPERELIEEDQAGSNPGQSHPTTEDQVHIENPPSLSGTLSSIKNLRDMFTFGDQFLNDKLRKEEPRRANVETKVESMVTVPIHQASSSVPLLSTPIINLSNPKPVSPPVQELIITAKTTTTITLPPPPLRPPRSTIDLDLATRISALETRSADFEQKNKLQDKTTQALASKIYKLENHDLYSKIDKQVNKVIKEAVYNALKAPLSLEASMQHENNDELHAALTKSRKRRCNDQDPPPPSLEESDRSKKKKHDSNVSALKQPPVKKSSAWKTSDSREAPFSSSKLEELVTSLWTESESDYDISSAYGISHWWFKRKEFYITRHSAASDRNAVISHMGILSVVSLKTYSRYGYTFLKEIVLQRADYKEYKISEADF